MCFFFLFLGVFNNFFTSTVDNENLRISFAPAIPTGVPITVANDAIETQPLVVNKTFKNSTK